MYTPAWQLVSNGRAFALQELKKCTQALEKAQRMAARVEEEHEAALDDLATLKLRRAAAANEGKGTSSLDEVCPHCSHVDVSPPL